jgi:hypothetical protein
MITVIKSWFLTNLIWVRIWPLAREILVVVADGKVTREEVKLAVDAAFGDREEIKLW